MGLLIANLLLWLGLGLIAVYLAKFVQENGMQGMRVLLLASILAGAVLGLFGTLAGEVSGEYLLVGTLLFAVVGGLMGAAGVVLAKLTGSMQPW
jgi:hypothetical protein